MVGEISYVLQKKEVSSLEKSIKPHIKECIQKKKKGTHTEQPLAES